MKHLLKYFFLIVFSGFALLSFSQNEVKKWYFGNSAGLDFMSAAPVSLSNGAMSTMEGCASVADAAGNLLFYTNGVTVWNKQHAVMANGTGLYGDVASSQSALIVKHPGSNSIYFIFTTDGGAQGLNYSEVDMSLAAGMGSVTVKNNTLSPSSTERLCGSKHCNGSDVWVISHERNSNVFRAHLLSAFGLFNTPVLSSIGSNMGGGNVSGCMKVSPNGKVLGTALSNAFELFDFDDVSGVLSNSLSLPVNAPGYGCEFSPDGTKFYGTLWSQSNNNNRLCQWDLCAGSPTAIAASATTFYDPYTGQLQLGPDGKIYQANASIRKIKMSPEISIDVTYGEPSLGVIHNPNAAAAQLNFNATAQPLNPAISMFGLPNFVSGFFKTPGTPFTYSINPAVSCLNAYFTPPPLINAGCSATSFTISNVQWLFDDPASGPANTSTQLNAQHLYPGIGIYNVRLVLLNACGGVIDTLKQQVVIGSALLNAPSSLSLCLGQSLTLQASGPATYSWSTGANANSIVVSPTVNTTYSLSFIDSFGCQYSSAHTVTVYPVPALSVLGKDSICAGGSTTLRVSGAVSYSWSTGTTNAAISVTPASTTAYTVSGSSLIGCSVNKIVPVVVKPAPVPVISGNTLVCEGSVASAVVQGNDTYVWNNGTKGATLTVVPDWNLGYIFAVKATYTNGCTRSQRIWFHLKPLPEITIAGTPSLCLGSAITLTAGGANTYTWSNGQISTAASLSPTITSTYSVTGTDTNNCVSSTEVEVKVNPSSPANAMVSGSVVICNGDSATLSAAGGEQFLWASNTSTNIPTSSVVVVRPSSTSIYSVTISTDNACASTKTVMVKVNPNPGLWAGPDTVFNLNEPMILSASGTGTFTWLGIDGTVCKDCRSIQVFPDKRTCYRVFAVNAYGCEANDEVCVDMGTVNVVYVPNAFSPNGDGLNEEFLTNGFGMAEMHLSVFDRWGARIFSSHNEKEGWNGNYNGKPCPAGTYNWLLEYVLANGVKQKKAGVVLLFR